MFTPAYPNSMEEWLDGQNYLTQPIFTADNLFRWLASSRLSNSLLKRRVEFLGRIKDYQGGESSMGWKKGYALFICACLASYDESLNSAKWIELKLQLLEREQCIVRVSKDEWKAKIIGVENLLFSELARWKWQPYNEEVDNQSWNLLCPFADWAWDVIQQFISYPKEIFISRQQSIVILNVTGYEQKSKLSLELVPGPGTLAIFPDPRSMSFISPEQDYPQSFTNSMINASKAVKHLGIYLTQSNQKIRWRFGPVSSEYYEFELPSLQGNSLGGTFAFLFSKLLAISHNMVSISDQNFSEKVIN